jgi:YfiH family protein
MMRWEAPGPYVVAFTTREGGVSTGAFSSLNLGSRADDAARITENRRRVCEELGLDPERLAVNRQRHTATVNRASAGETEEIGDALWTEQADLPLLALAADCVPIAVARTRGAPALAVVHAGWRGLAAGVVASAVGALGPGETAAIIGPSIGACCYEVGPEVAKQFEADLMVGRHLDLWTAAERALRDAGVGSVERLDVCTRCNHDRFFSHRFSGPHHGSQGVIGAVAG